MALLFLLSGMCTRGGGEGGARGAAAPVKMIMGGA